MRLIHTADWHLGHTLHGISRVYEHEQFLNWLVTHAQERAVDALIIAGDIFDSGNPPAYAQTIFYRFLRQARQACPHLEIIIIAGNHDSAARLEAPAPLLRELGIHVIGSLPHSLDKLLIPLRDASGETAVWCAAVPFLRVVDLPLREGCEEPLIDGVREVYARILDKAFANCRNGESVIATGHCYFTGTQLSELSERRILGGNQHALPADIFPEELHYAALGHLHLAQPLSKDSRNRYSGSPIPLSLNEGSYPHQVVEVNISAAIEVTTQRIPRAVEIFRLPPLPLAEAMDYLAAQEWQDLPPERYPFLEAQIKLEKPETELRQKLETVLAKKPVRLLKITPHYTGSGKSLAESIPQAALHELTPDQVFLKRYQRDYEGEPTPELWAAFHELLENVEYEE